jgi:hypothetical protein
MPDTTPTTTTTLPPTTTTEAPRVTTTAPPEATTPPPATTSPETTTEPPATTTAPPETTTPAAGTTTGAATSSTTAPPASTTAGGGTDDPKITSVEVKLDPDDGTEHNDHSIQVAADVKLTLKWETSGASGIHVENLGDFEASGETELPSKDATYSIVAKGSGSAESPPWPLEIHVHDPDEVVSQHVDVGSGVAAFVSFQAMKDGAPITDAQVGDQIDLVVVVSDAVEGVKIADQDCELTDTGDGHKQGKLSVTIEEGQDGSYAAQLVKDGTPGESQQIQVHVGLTTTTTAPPTSTTGGPGTTTTSPSSTTTAPSSTTTAPASTTTGPATTTTAIDEPWELLFEVALSDASGNPTDNA